MKLKEIQNDEMREWLDENWCYPGKVHVTEKGARIALVRDEYGNELILNLDRFGHIEEIGLFDSSRQEIYPFNMFACKDVFGGDWGSDVSTEVLRQLRERDIDDMLSWRIADKSLREWAEFGDWTADRSHFYPRGAYFKGKTLDDIAQQEPTVSWKEFDEHNATVRLSSYLAEGQGAVKAIVDRVINDEAVKKNIGNQARYILHKIEQYESYLKDVPARDIRARGLVDALKELQDVKNVTITLKDSEDEFSVRYALDRLIVIVENDYSVSSWEVEPSHRDRFKAMERRVVGDRRLIDERNIVKVEYRKKTIWEDDVCE